MNLSPELARLIGRAAELRLAGRSWRAIADEVGRAERTCRGWPTHFPEHWASATRHAESALLDEIGRESVLCLRQLLRSEDEKIVREAAQALLKYRSDCLEEQPRSEITDPDLLYLASLSHEERDTLLDQLLATEPVVTAAIATETESGSPRPE